LPLCRIYFLFLHLPPSFRVRRNDYIFKMKDLARFSGGKEQTLPASGNAAALHQVQYVDISPEESGQRIDNFLIRICKGVPKSHLYRILRSGEVRVNKGRVDQTYRLEAGDVVRIPPLRMKEKEESYVPGSEFNILLEDNVLLVIDKPAGVAVHGGSGVSYGVIEQLRAARPQAKFLELVHRLDRETSGILMLAKKRSALTNLHEQIREGSMDKRYLTLVHGDWKNDRQHVRLRLHKYNTGDGERRVRVQQDGMESHTVFNLVKKLGEFALLEAELKTGRTHQIRVHLASSGFAIAGDDKYGDFALNKRLQKTEGERVALKRMFLHAYRLTLRHPETGEPLTLHSPLPPECQRFLESLGLKAAAA
jgi:23S rRNA pseudouridine955/2504/2580 synthase